MPRLSILHTLRETLNLFFREWPFFIRLLIGPIVVLTGVSLLNRVAAGTPLKVLVFVVLTLYSVKVAISCHRFILLGETSSFLHGFKWQMRDTWFTGAVGTRSQ